MYTCKNIYIYIYIYICIYMCMDAVYDGQHHLGGNIPHRALRSPVVEVGPALVGPTSLPLRRGKHRGHRGHRGHCGCGVRRAVRRQQLTSVLGSTKRQKASNASSEDAHAIIIAYDCVACAASSDDRIIATRMR